MGSIQRFDPFFDTPFDDLFRGGWWPTRWAGKPMQARMDVSEGANAYTVKAELPGVKREDIRVVIERNQVTISGEVKEEKEDKRGEEVLAQERYYGKITRSFTLGHEIDQTKAEAKYTDGVLQLTLPKRAPSGGKEISIQ